MRRRELGGDLGLFVNSQMPNRRPLRGGERKSCGEYDKTARVAFPTCGARLDALQTCLAKASLACEGGSDFVVFAAGSGATSSLSVYLVGPYLLRLKTAECNAAAEAWRDCTFCGQALGYDGTAGGVGDTCTSSSQCATGLSCQGGGCFKSCTRSEECLPRHPSGKNSCQTNKGRSVECRSGTCATYCHLTGYEIYVCPPGP